MKYLKNILQNIVQSWPCLLFLVVFKVVWWWDIWWTWKESGRAPTDSVVTHRITPPSIVEFVLLFHAELMAPSTRSCVSGKKSPLLLKTKRLPDSCDETARRRSKGATINAPKKRQQEISQCSLDQSDKARILKVFHHFLTKSALQLRSLIPAKISTQSQLAQLVLL